MNRTADVLDVHILDIAAQLEALLRDVREVQRSVLRLRGAQTSSTGESPPDQIRRRLSQMRQDWAALGDAIQAASDTADTLPESTGSAGDGQ